MGDAPVENHIDTMVIKGVTDDDVLLSLVSNASLFKVRYVRAEILGLEIYKNVSIPRVR